MTAVATLFGCPIAGVVAPISQCPDSTFAQGILGPGIVIQPEGSIVFAPADATVEFSLATPFVFCNTGEGGWQVEILRTGPTPAGEDVVRVTPLSSQDMNA